MRLLSSFLVGAILWGGLISRAVLCVGTGDHRAIELAGAACCEPARADTGGGRTGLGAACAQSCTDIPLGCPSTVRSPDGSERRQTGGAWWATSTPPTAAMVVGIQPNSPDRSALLAAHERRVIRTTVILC